MLATPELIRETGQLAQLEELLPRWRKMTRAGEFYRGICSAPEEKISHL
jgi:hypothetical protein